MTFKWKMKLTTDYVKRYFYVTKDRYVAYTHVHGRASMCMYVYLD